MLNFKYIILLFIIAFHSSVSAFELSIIQSVSRSGQTFITRTGKKDGVHEGKKATFTAENVSIIAKAINVTREFTQWEIENNFTDIPFRKGQVVTYYDTTEYLWALTPEVVKTKFVKSNYYSPRKAFGINTALISTISESTTGVSSNTTDRGGLAVEVFAEKEFNPRWSVFMALRYTTERLNVPEATYLVTRYLALIEGRYYFEPIKNFFGARVSLGIGFGYGQSNTETDGLTSSGTALILPLTKGAISFPISKTSEFSFETAFESLQTTEAIDGESDEQVSQINNLKYGISIKRYFE